MRLVDRSGRAKEPGAGRDGAASSDGGLSDRTVAARDGILS
jgi:hypothetical protein